MNPTRILIAAALLLGSGAATAQSATDAQCLLLSNALGKQAKEPEQQKTAEAMFYFYVSRVKDGMTSSQLKALFDTATKSLTDANAGPKVNDCLKAIQTRVDLLQSLAPAASASGQQSAPSKPQQPQSKPEGR